MDEMQVRQIVQITIAELRRQELLRESDRIAYSEISDRLRRYYTDPFINHDEEEDTELSKALSEVRKDRYFKIILLFYRDSFTVEMIAEKLGVDVRTVTRNKKRLCLEIYNRMS